MEDLHSKILDARGPPPTQVPNSFNVMQLLGNLAKLYVCVPRPKVGTHIGEILALLQINLRKHGKLTALCITENFFAGYH